MTPIVLTPQAIESLTTVLAKELGGEQAAVREFITDQYHLLNRHTGSSDSVNAILDLASTMYDEAAEEGTCHCELHDEFIPMASEVVSTYEFTSAKKPNSEVEALSSHISKNLQKDRLSQLIANQVEEQESLSLYDEQENFSVEEYDFDEDLDDKGLAYEFEELLESLLDGLADALIEEGLLDEMFTIGENSTELYSLYFQTRFFQLLEEINFPDEVEYTEEYTAYLMGALSHRLITEKGYMLYFHIENDIVFPVLKPQAQ